MHLFPHAHTYTSIQSLQFLPGAYLRVSYLWTEGHFCPSLQPFPKITTHSRLLWNIDAKNGKRSECFPLRHQHTNTDLLCESQGHIILHWDISGRYLCSWARYRFLNAVLYFSHSTKCLIFLLPHPYSWHKMFSQVTEKAQEGEER